MLFTKVAYKVQIFRLATLWIKICQIPHVITGNESQVFFQTLHHSSMSSDITPVYFFI